MAATDRNPPGDPGRPGLPAPLPPTELERRLDEEIGRAERHGTMLSCLLVVVENIEELPGELRSQTLDYISGALGAELRRFDRIGRPSAAELAIVLPGAGGPDGEVVARRVLERVRAIKVESEGTRHPLELSVGLAAWRAQMSAAALLARARAASGRQNGEEPPAGAAAVGGTPIPPAEQPDSAR